MHCKETSISAKVCGTPTHKPEYIKKNNDIPPVIAGSQQFVCIWFLPVGNDVMHYSKESYYDVNLLAQ